MPRCGEDVYYRNEDKQFTDRWMTGWAWLCFLSTLFTLLTFWVEPTRFRYPERPIVFLALCYNLTALAYILRGAVGPQQFGCATQDDGPSYVPVCFFFFLLVENSACGYFKLLKSIMMVVVR